MPRPHLPPRLHGARLSEWQTCQILQPLAVVRLHAYPLRCCLLRLGCQRFHHRRHDKPRPRYRCGSVEICIRRFHHKVHCRSWFQQTLRHPRYSVLLLLPLSMVLPEVQGNTPRRTAAPPEPHRAVLHPDVSLVHQPVLLRRDASPVPRKELGHHSDCHLSDSHHSLHRYPLPSAYGYQLVEEHRPERHFIAPDHNPLHSILDAHRRHSRCNRGRRR